MIRKPVSSKRKEPESSQSDSEDEPLLKIQIKDDKKRKKKGF